MTLRILTLAALLGMATSTASTTAFASEDSDAVSALAIDEAPAMMSEDPSTARPPRFRPAPRRPVTECFARNITGRTFGVRGDFRVAPRFIQQRAVQICQRNSGFFRFSCRAIGCRRAWH